MKLKRSISWPESSSPRGTEHTVGALGGGEALAFAEPQSCSRGCPSRHLQSPTCADVCGTSGTPGLPGWGLLGLAQGGTSGFQLCWIILVDEKLEVSWRKLTSMSAVGAPSFCFTCCCLRPRDNLRGVYEPFTSPVSSSQRGFYSPLARDLSPPGERRKGNTARIPAPDDGSGTKGTHWSLIPRYMHTEEKSQTEKI